MTHFLSFSCEIILDLLLTSWRISDIFLHSGNGGETQVNMYEGKAKLEKFVRNQALQMQEYASAKYGFVGFNIEVTIKSVGKPSWGGVSGGNPFIEIDIQKYIPSVISDGNIDFNEYPSFAWDKNIGSLNNVHWTKAVTALVAHEVSHAIQFFSPLSVVDKLFSSNSFVGSKDLRGHKKLWRNIYQDLRKEFVNKESSVEQVIVPPTPEILKIEVTPKVEKPVVKNTQKKGWTRRKYRAHGGLVVEYIDTDTGNIIVTVLDRPNKNVFVLDTVNNKFVDSGSESREEVRNRYL